MGKSCAIRSTYSTSGSVALLHMIGSATVRDLHLVAAFLRGGEDRQDRGVKRKTTEWKGLRQQNNCARVIQPGEFLSGLFPWFRIGPSSC